MSILPTSLAVAVLLLFTGCAPEHEPLPVTPPNIIFIMADDLGYGDLGSYGQKEIQTPSLDRMAREGMRFTQFYAGSTVCAPSRAVLMSGIPIGRNPIRGNREIRPMGQFPIPDSIVTVAEVLQGAGYRTGLVGKWGLGAPGSEGIPNNQGFDYFVGYLGQRHAHNFYPEFLFRNEERFSLAGNVLPEPKREDGAGQAIEKGTYSHDLLAEEALQFINTPDESPFFLFLSLTIPHANNEAGDEGMEVPELGAYVDRDWPEPQKGLAAMISRMDSDIGRMLDLLSEKGIDNNTIVLFTSDNGPHREGGNDPDYFDSNGPLRGIKRALYEGGIRVPLIAWWPGQIEAGTQTDHIGYFGDIMATAADLAGVPSPAGVKSNSLLPTLLGSAESQETHPFLYWEFYEQGSRQAVRFGDWKAIREPMFNGDLALYNLSNDQEESQDVSGSYPEIVQEALRIMQEAHIPDPNWTVPAQ